MRSNTAVPDRAAPQGDRADRAIVIASLVVWFIGAYAIAARWNPWGDEGRFLDIVRAFGSHVALDGLRTYRAMTTPLSFLVYAAWGHLVGFETWQLRLLSAILAIATFALLDHVLRRSGASRSMRCVTLAVLCVNPYVIGTSVFVFTDMLALLMLVIVMAGMTNIRPWLVAVGVGGGLLTRQYNAFVALGAVITAAGAWRHGARRFPLAVLGWTAIAIVPFAWLAWLWRGLAPVNDLRADLLSAGLRFNPRWLSLYLAAPGVYLAPLVVWSMWRRRPRRNALAVGFAGAMFTLVFPIQPAAVQVAQCCADTGYAHRALLKVPLSFFASTAFAIAAFAWLSVMAETLFQSMARWRSRAAPIGEVFPWLALASFLLVMPWSYMPWEKYALPELVCAAVILATRGVDGQLR
jgi:hypothetical protein